MRSTMDLKRVVSAGAGLIIDGSRYSAMDLKAIVGCAKAPVTIKNVKDFSAMDLKSIAVAGNGHVIFDLCD